MKKGCYNKHWPKEIKDYRKATHIWEWVLHYINMSDLGIWEPWTSTLSTSLKNLLDQEWLRKFFIWVVIYLLTATPPMAREFKVRRKTPLKSTLFMNLRTWDPSRLITILIGKEIRAWRTVFRILTLRTRIRSIKDHRQLYHILVCITTGKSLTWRCLGLERTSMGKSQI